MVREDRDEFRATATKKMVRGERDDFSWVREVHEGQGDREDRDDFRATATKKLFRGDRDEFSWVQEAHAVQEVREDREDREDY